MFTGIVEETGTVVESGPRVRLRGAGVAAGARPGDSIAVSGVCLTVVAVDPSTDDERGAVLTFDLSDETLARTTLGQVSAGDRVNLERPVGVVRHGERRFAVFELDDSHLTVELDAHTR